MQKVHCSDIIEAVLPQLGEGVSEINSYRRR